MRPAAAAEGGGDFDPAAWFRLLHGFAETYAIRCDLGDFANDIAQQAFALLWERLQSERRAFRADEAERLVRSLADAEHHARDVGRRHLTLVRGDVSGPGTPELCADVARLTPAYPRPAAFRTRLRATAHCVARIPGVLRDRQLRVFDLVWIAGAPAGATGRLLGASDRAMSERLRRASDRIEKRIVGDLREAIPASTWAAMHLFLADKGGRPPARAVAEAVFAGLARVIHTCTLSLGIE